jgi:hypothetical protein
MNLKKWVKTFLALVAILLIATIIPVTFSDNTAPDQHQQEFQVTQAKLVNFLMYLYQTLNDFDEDRFNEELLENLQVEIELALIVAHQSSSTATIENSLGFLKIASSLLLENAIENEMNAIESLVDEINALNKEGFTSFSWGVLQEQLEKVEEINDYVLQELDELEFVGDSDENEQEAISEISVRELPDLTPHLRKIFETLIEIHEALVSSYDALEVITTDEVESDKSENNINAFHDSEHENYCPRRDDECRIALLQATRLELHHLLININDDIENVNHSGLETVLWNELQMTMQHAIEALISNDIEEMLKALELLEIMFVSLELN